MGIDQTVMVIRGVVIPTPITDEIKIRVDKRHWGVAGNTTSLWEWLQDEDAPEWLKCATDEETDQSLIGECLYQSPYVDGYAGSGMVPIQESQHSAELETMLMAWGIREPVKTYVVVLWQ